MALNTSLCPFLQRFLIEQIALKDPSTFVAFTVASLTETDEKTGIELPGQSYNIVTVCIGIVSSSLSKGLLLIF